jgi:hypothetical protein
MEQVLNYMIQNPNATDEQVFTHFNTVAGWLDQTFTYQELADYLTVVYGSQPTANTVMNLILSGLESLAPTNPSISKVLKNLDSGTKIRPTGPSTLPVLQSIGQAAVVAGQLTEQEFAQFIGAFRTLPFVTLEQIALIRVQFEAHNNREDLYTWLRNRTTVAESAITSGQALTWNDVKALLTIDPPSNP